MTLRRALAALLVVAILPLAACGTISAGAKQTPAGTRPPFSEWLAAFRADAQARGISETTLERAFAGIAPNEAVIAQDRSQPEFARPIWDYLARAVSTDRVETGRARYAAYAGTLSGVSRDYGVPGKVLVAIWGIESNYGSNTGGYNVFEALATLAWDGRRPEWARAELMNALRIADDGNMLPERMTGSWAGAMGQTQFMPSTYLRYAVDRDGDGRRDLWDSMPDVFASTARALAAGGWNPSIPWGWEVTLPAGFDWTEADATIRKPLEKWRELGVRRADGRAIPAGKAEAAIILPAGHLGPAFLVTDTFRAIRSYNNSTAYALAVADLADRIAGGGPFARAWPAIEPVLARTDRMSLQTLLNMKGYDAGPVDGRIGPMTRAAVRRFQEQIGEIPDGFPTMSLLQRLQAQAAG